MWKTCRIWGCLAVAVVFAMVYRPAAGCLRATLDVRAVQWATLIVQAKLVTVGDPEAIAGPADASTRPAALGYQVYTFEVSKTLDGKAKAGDQIQVIRFFWNQDGDNTICGQSLAADQVGKSFLLLLTPEADLRWGASPDEADPRTASVHAIKAYAVVYLQGSSDLDADGMADFVRLIADTRAATAQYSPADGTLQATTLADAADDTEADQAEHALLEMGPVAVAQEKEVASKAGDVGKARLEKVIGEVSAPGIGSAESSK
jgi:hypothetical protein